MCFYSWSLKAKEVAVLVIGVSVVAIILWYGVLIGWRFWRFVVANRAALLVTRPYSKQLSGSKTHIIVIGDSTMYGAGIKDPANTIGGLLAAQYPSATIETIAVNGARVRDLQAQLKSAQYRHYKLVVLGIGGNDIVKLSNYRRLRRELADLLKTMSQRSDRVVLVHCVNVGNIGFFPFPLDHFFDYRTRRLSHVYTVLAKAFHKVAYVNFYRPMHDDYYTKATRAAFVADDAFHPNDYANRFFFDLILARLRELED